MSNPNPLGQFLPGSGDNSAHSQSGEPVNESQNPAYNEKDINENLIAAQWYVITQTLHRVLGKSDLYDKLVTELAQALYQDQAKTIESHLYDASDLPLPGMVYCSTAMHDLAAQIHKVRDSKMAVLITGESGTGKEGIARAIHTLSSRQEGPFVAFNCTVVTKELISSQLFGHRKGSFTGADSHYQGSIRSAEGGTIFLDEIGDLPLELQPKLLRFLQEGEVHPVGETNPVKVNVRVIAATNHDIEAMVAKGEFREDLYYRINVLRFHMPPLRERREEIPALSYNLLERFSQDARKSGLTFAPETLAALTASAWPGNIRQLANEIQRAIAVVSNREIIQPQHLSLAVSSDYRKNGKLDWVDEILLSLSARGNPEVKEEIEKTPESVNQSRAEVAESSLVPENVVVEGRKTLHSGQTLADEVKELEKGIIVSTLTKLNFNLSQTAKELGLTRRGLYLKMGRYEIDPKYLKITKAQVSGPA